MVTPATPPRGQELTAVGDQYNLGLTIIAPTYDLYHKTSWQFKTWFATLATLLHIRH